MNQFAVGTIRYKTGFAAWIRKVHKAENELVCENGQPIIYGTRMDAYRAATETLLRYLNTEMRRDGAVIEARSVADSHFNLPARRKVGA